MRFKIWLIMEWLPSQDARDESRSNERDVLKRFDPWEYLCRGWAISLLFSLFQLSCLQFVKSIRVFFDVLLLSISLIVLLSLSICYVVESWSLFASFEMNEFLNLRHWLIQIGIKRWDCLSSLDHKEQAWKWERGGEIERKKRRLQSSEIVHKNEKDE